MKRFLYSGLLMLVIVFWLACFSLSVFATESESLLRFVLDGVTYELSYSSDVTWDDLLNDQVVYLPNGYSIQWIDDNGYIAMDLVKTDGDRSQYYLSDLTDFDNPYGLGKRITKDHAVFTDEPYQTSVTIPVEIEQVIYSFEYPSCYRTWNDLLHTDSYYHPELGECRWESYSDNICLSFVRNGEVVEYFLKTVDYGSIWPERSLYEGDLAGSDWFFTTLICPHSNHTYEIETIVEQTCTVGGEYIYTCSRCGYVKNVQTAPSEHVFSFWHWLTLPSCTQAGSMRMECINCGVYEDHFAAPLGHDFPIVGQCRRDGCTAYTGQNAVEGIDKWWDSTTDAVSKGWDAATDAVGKGWNAVTGAVGNFFKDFPQNAGDTVDDVTDWVKDRVKNVFSSDDGFGLIEFFGVFAGLAFVGVLILLFLKIRSKIKSK